MKTSRKAVQIAVNLEIEREIDAINSDGIFEYRERLRTCSAYVYETEHYFILRSYNTFVAAVNKETGECYDFLRKVFGYTSTSSQHISKFWHDYAWSGKVLTWRYVK